MKDTSPASAPTLCISRRALLALGGGALASALVGCSPSRSIVVKAPVIDDADVQLTFFGNKYEPLSVNAVEDILRSYMDAHPDTSIVYESIKGTAYYDALGKRLITGNGDDVFMVDHDTVLAFADRGCLAALDDLPAISSFSPLALGQMRSEGPVYYVPTSISAFGLYCNTEMLASRGIEIPGTFPELLSACEKFAKAGTLPVVANNDISLKTFALARGLASVYAGGNAEDRVAALTDDPRGFARLVRPGFEAVEELVRTGAVDAQLALATEKTSDDLDQFATGEHPFMLTGAWASARVHDMAPDLAFEVHPLPALDDGSALVVNMDTRVSVNADGSNVEAALRFVEHLTQPASVGLLANSLCSFSPLVGMAAPDDASLRPLAEAFDEGIVVIGSDDNLRLPVWSALHASVTALLQGISAPEVEKQLAKTLAPEGGDAS